MWQNFSLLFDAIASEKYLSYAIYVKHARYFKLAVFQGIAGPKVAQRIKNVGSVYCASLR